MYFYSSLAGDTPKLSNVWGDFNKVINYIIDGGTLIDIVKIEPNNATTVKVYYDITKTLPWTKNMTITISGSTSYNGNLFIDSINDVDKYAICYSDSIAGIGSITEISNGTTVVLKAKTVACGATRLLGGISDNRTIIKFDDSVEFRIDDRDFGPLVNPVVTFNNGWTKCARVCMAENFETLDFTSKRHYPYNGSRPTESFAPTGKYIGQSIVPYNTPNGTAYIIHTTTKYSCGWKIWASSKCMYIQIYAPSTNSYYSYFIVIGGFDTIDKTKPNGIMETWRPYNGTYDSTANSYFNLDTAGERGGLSYSPSNRSMINLQIYNNGSDADVSVLYYGSGGYGAAPPSAQGGFPAPNPVDGSLYFSDCQLAGSTGLYGTLYDIKWVHNTVTLTADDILIIDNEYYMVIRSFDASIMVKLDR